MAVTSLLMDNGVNWVQFKLCFQYICLVFMKITRVVHIAIMYYCVLGNSGYGHCRQMLQNNSYATAMYSSTIWVRYYVIYDIFVGC